MLQLRLPRLLTCLRCEGGGCDACERRGAFSRDKLGGQEAEPLVVTLPKMGREAAEALQLRLPGQGALSSDDSLPPGHLLLTVRAAQAGCETSPTVTRVAVGGVGLKGRFSLFSPLGVLVIGMLGFVVLWWMLK